ncbi:MAG TPA: galactokinase, partial [Actinomycetota bacterium]|nr:galactokinase [Actinomycetota bacterium]
MPDPEHLRREFFSRMGSHAAGVWSAPGRVNLIGEHTDYNQGLVLPIAINARTFVAAAPRSDGVLRGWSAQDTESFKVRVDRLSPGAMNGWGSYACGPAWVLAREGRAVPGADLLVDSNVPLGAGLSSSAALQVAVALAFSDMTGEPLSGAELAMVAHRSETEYVGVPVGTMDQMISALGRRNSALFLDTRDGSFEYVPFEPSTAGLSLVVIDTRASHSLREGQYAQRRATCEAAAAALGLASLREATLDLVSAGRLSEVEQKRARHVITENERVLEVVAELKKGNLQQVGSAFVRSHQSLRDLYEVSSPELDLAVESALESGA